MVRKQTVIPVFLNYMQVTRKNNQVSDYYLYDASFLRVKTIQLGYTIPKNLIPKVRIRAYCNLENFFTITSYPGMDPEMDGDVGYPYIEKQYL